MIRLLFLLHRYLGIAVGFVLLLWCLSGFVMLYMPFPEMDARSSAIVAPPLNLGECCAFPDNPGLSAVPFTFARMEMLDDRTPVLRAGLPQAAALKIDLRKGREFDDLAALGSDVDIAGDFSRRLLDGALVSGPERIQQDQWTITEEYRPHRPLWKYTAADEAGTQWYVSGRTGEVVLVTTRRERLWNYAGAVVHWLYPVILRQNTALWSQTVIYLSLVGGFLTLTGLYIGVRQFRRRRTGRYSPYTGWALWHHYSGMVFGIVTLLWVVSGTLSMNPWGLLEGEGRAEEIEALRDGHLNWSDIRRTLLAARDQALPEGTVALELTKQAGTPVLFATLRDGDRVRLNARDFRREAVSEPQLRALAARLPGDVSLQEFTLLQEEDAYYYDRQQAPELPVWRIRTQDDERRLYYLSATTGELLLKVDAGARAYRWWFIGLHRGDFLAVLRQTPIRDLFLWVFLLGATAVCATGTWMAVRRLRSA
ncbi:MAG: PepSY domain-containing protein [Pseudomonadales bacterium]|nr:PepSY domain-containing protein [Pseudomonadales bacterium]